MLPGQRYCCTNLCPCGCDPPFRLDVALWPPKGVWRQSCLVFHSSWQDALVGRTETYRTILLCLHHDLESDTCTVQYRLQMWSNVPCILKMDCMLHIERDIGYMYMLQRWHCATVYATCCKPDTRAICYMLQAWRACHRPQATNLARVL